jgi:apolipoprotein N-acyltransferase
MTGIFRKIGAHPWLRSARRMSALLAASGILTGLCVCFPVMGVLEWVSLVPALAVFFSQAADESVPLRRLYRHGLIFFYAFSLVIFHWFFYMYPLEFAGVYPAVALLIVLFATLGLSLLQTVFAALFPLLLGVISRGRVIRRYPFLQVVVMAFLWCVREWAQTLNWTGVPWGRLALGQATMPVMLQTARWFGPYIVTFVIVLVSGCIAYALLHTDCRRLCAIVGVGVFALQLTLGSVILLTDAGRSTDKTVRVVAIQGNIGTADKWTVPAAECYEVYYTLAEQAAKAGADLIVWPETAVPANLAEYFSGMERLSALAKEYEVTLLLGTFVGAKEGDYNAILRIDEQGNLAQEFYAKRRPVPFGEYVPLRPLFEIVFPPLLELSQLAEDVIPGKDSRVFDTAVGNIGSLICFDSIYEALALDSARDGAELLCISTNDSWFFDSAAVHMHNAQAKLRAIETGRYVVRAANTGVSSVITPTGKEVTRLEALEQGIVMAEVELRSDMTLYARIGNWWIYLCLGVSALLLGERAVTVIGTRKKEKEKS